MTIFLIAGGIVLAIYAGMAIMIAATAFTRRARERAQFWQVSREAAQWRASVPPRYRRKLFAAFSGKS